MILKSHVNVFSIHNRAEILNETAFISFFSFLLTFRIRTSPNVYCPSLELVMRYAYIKNGDSLFTTYYSIIFRDLIFSRII